VAFFDAAASRTAAPTIVRWCLRLHPRKLRVPSPAGSPSALPELPMVETAIPPLPDEHPAPRLRWWCYVIALISLGTLASRAGNVELARASDERANARLAGAGGRPFEIATGTRGLIVSPARFERWALWGFLLGALDGLLTSPHAWPSESSPICSRWALALL
jgi:hypothetical protein